MDVLCKMTYHRFVGAAILLLANVFHCADCVDNIIINDIPCVKRKELGIVLVKWIPISIITWTKSIADCLLVRETFFVVLLVAIFGGQHTAPQNPSEVAAAQALQSLPS